MADPWDIGHVGNGFTFKGVLNRNHLNDVYAFTVGQGEFISVSAANLLILVADIERRSKEVNPKTKRAKNHLIISVPPNGSIIQWIKKLNDPKANLEHLSIHLYASPDRAESNPNTTFAFYNIKLIGDGQTPKLFGFIPLPTATYFTFEFNYLEITGQKG